MKYREYIRACVVGPGILGLFEALTAVVSQGSRIFPALVSRYRKLPRGTDFTGILQRRQDQYIHERMLI